MLQQRPGRIDVTGGLPATVEYAVPESHDAAITRLAAHLRSAHRITVLTGAGVSAASGVPTFRGADGLWRTHRPEDLATPEAFAHNPDLVWEWYDWRRQLVAACQPNRAHAVLADWSHRWSHFTLITQNVDGLHERAGTLDVLRFHGSIWELRCWNNCAASPARWPDETTPLSTRPPLCPACGGLARPGVVWFGEAIDPEILDQSLASADCDLFLTVGTSSLVYPAASLVQQAKALRAVTAEINLDVTPASGLVDITLRGPAEALLAAVEEARATGPP